MTPAVPRSPRLDIEGQRARARSAAYCGFGRSPVAELPGILADHLRAARAAG